jgi:hypothetical protein
VGTGKELDASSCRQSAQSMSYLFSLSLIVLTIKPSMSFVEWVGSVGRYGSKECNNIWRLEVGGATSIWESQCLDGTLNMYREKCLEMLGELDSYRIVHMSQDKNERANMLAQ